MFLTGSEHSRLRSQYTVFLKFVEVIDACFKITIRLNVVNFIYTT